MASPPIFHYALIANLRTAALVSRTGSIAARVQRRRTVGEGYDPIQRELLGNFPQALTHVALVNTVRNLLRSGGPAETRADESADPVNPAPPE